MKKFKWTIALAITPMAALPITVSLTACSSKSFLDYSDVNNYIYSKTIPNAKYDLIFLVGTSIFEPTPDRGFSKGVGFDANTMKPMGFQNYCSVGSQLASSESNIYVPLYRQIALYYALDTYKTHNGIIDDIKDKEPYQDLKAFFDYYFTYINVNAARPFVIAGHSQGAASLQVVLEKYFINGGHKQYLKNMVAAYAVGYGVSKKWFDGLNKTVDGENVIHFATGEIDTNCLISWNTEGKDATGKSFLLPDDENDTYIINPLNWKTDNTKATVSENKGILLKKTTSTNYEVPTGFEISTTGEPGSEKGSRELMDAQIDLKRGSIICTTNTDFMTVEGFSELWGGKSLHTYDGKGYYVNMSINIQKRIDEFLKK